MSKSGKTSFWRGCGYLRFATCYRPSCSTLEFGAWSLPGAWYLELGIWSLVFGVWCLVFGVWCLVFGVWCLVSRGSVLHPHPVEARGGAGGIGVGPTGR